MKVAIMQPYFLPYIGYFQLLAAVDLFIVYDNIKFTKKGWLNRNRMLRQGKDEMFTLPLMKGSDFLDVRERELAVDFDRAKLLNQFKEAYRRAPHFGQTFPLMERIFGCEEVNLFRFLYRSILEVGAHLNVGTEIRISSDMDVDHHLKGQDKVLALCEAAGAQTYVNAVGGVALYSKDVFYERGVELQFIKSRPFDYEQFGDPFVPWLSIVDVLMFNSLQSVKTCIASNYELI